MGERAEITAKKWSVQNRTIIK